MKYKLTLKNKLYLMFHQSYIDRLNYLILKVEKHTIEYFNKNNIKLPVNLYKYVLTQAEHLLFEYENNLESQV
jgi:hypothetical protein